MHLQNWQSIGCVYTYLQLSITDACDLYYPLMSNVVHKALGNWLSSNCMWLVVCFQPSQKGLKNTFILDKPLSRIMSTVNKFKDLISIKRFFIQETLLSAVSVLLYFFKRIIKKRKMSSANVGEGCTLLVKHEF